MSRAGGRKNNNTRAANVARRNAIKNGQRDPSDCLDSVLVDPEFDKVDQIDLEEYVGRGRGTSNYD